MHATPPRNKRRRRRSCLMSAIDLSGYRSPTRSSGGLHRCGRRARPAVAAPLHPGRVRGHRHRVRVLFPTRGALHRPDVPAARGGQRRARGDLRRRHPGRDVPAHRHERPARRLHGRVEPGPKGDDFDPKAGQDPTLYGHRASAESARLSKHVAAQVYGRAPHHSYVWGGSGGGRRSPLCLENAPGVWDGCMPSTSGGEIAPPGNTQRVKAGSIMSFGQMFNVQRLPAGTRSSR